MSIDLTTITLIWLGAALLMIPLLGVTARFAVAPVIHALAAFRAAGSRANRDRGALGERIARMEERLNRLEDASREASAASGLPYA